MRKRICLIAAAAILLIAGVMLAGVLFGDAPVSHVTATDPERSGIIPMPLDERVPEIKEILRRHVREERNVTNL